MSVLLVFIFAACAKDHLLAPEKNLVKENPVLAEAEAYVAQEVAELEKDFNDPPALYSGISSRAIHYVFPGVGDGLRKAISQAGWGDQIVIKAGEHNVSGTVMIEKPLDIVGEDGAKMVFDIPAIEPEVPLSVAAFYIKNTSGVRIQGLEIEPKNGTSVFGILAQDASHVWIADNKITDFISGVYLVNSDEMRVYGNELTGWDRHGVGIGLTNGYNTKIRGNVISEFQAAIFPTGDRGIVYGNEMFDNNVGYILSQNGGWTLPDGTVTIPDQPSNQWTAKLNNAHNNDWGYLIIDGAFNNFTFANLASDNAMYDIELAGESFRFGGETPVPTSKNNIVHSHGQGFDDVTIKDCGEDNQIFGGQLVDTTNDACF